MRMGNRIGQLPPTGRHENCLLILRQEMNGKRHCHVLGGSESEWEHFVYKVTDDVLVCDVQSYLVYPNSLVPIKICSRNY